MIHQLTENSVVFLVFLIEKYLAKPTKYCTDEIII